MRKIRTVCLSIILGGAATALIVQCGSYFEAGDASPAVTCEVTIHLTTYPDLEATEPLARVVDIPVPAGGCKNLAGPVLDAVNGYDGPTPDSVVCQMVLRAVDATLGTKPVGYVLAPRPSSGCASLADPIRREVRTR